MVTHGGYGTVLGGLRSGVPMVAAPMFADQRDNAARLAAVGAGVHVQPSAEPVAVPPQLGDGVGAAVRRLSAEMAGQPPIGSVVGLIEAVAGG